jgi:hypothetical protein
MILLGATYSTWGRSVSAAPTDDDIITATEKNKQINADDVIVVDADFPGRASLLWALVNNAVQRNPEQGVPLISLISFFFFFRPPNNTGCRIFRPEAAVARR